MNEILDSIKRLHEAEARINTWRPLWRQPAKVIFVHPAHVEDRECTAILRYWHERGIATVMVLGDLKLPGVPIDRWFPAGSTEASATAEVDGSRTNPPGTTPMPRDSP